MTLDEFPGTRIPGITSEMPDRDQQLEVYQRQLRRLASELSLAEARERREIASDLHDHVGQALAYVSQKIGILKGNAVFSGMEDQFSEVLSILGQTIKYTRDLTVELSPPVLYELGLPAAIDWLAERMQARHQLTIETFHDGDVQHLDDDVKVFVFKAAHELIVNAAKHARADKVTVRLEWGDDSALLTVRDNGCGFDAACLEREISERNCFGLFSIRERLSYIGGNMVIKSNPGRGTAVTITFGCKPLERTDD